MKTSSNWLNVIRRKFTKNSSSRDIIVIHSNPTSKSHVETPEEEEEDTANLLIDLARASTVSLPAKPPTKEDTAATTIQAYFRSHLARRAFRALRGIVKLQAMVRGARVRKQARIAMHCMHAMVRLQVSVRTRQLLGATPPRLS